MSAPAPRSNAAAQAEPRDLWLPVTVAVAWELVMARVNVRPQLLADAREHVLRCLPEELSVEAAVALTAIYTQDYMIRVREGRYRQPAVEPEWEMELPPWRSKLMEGLDPIADAVFRLHFGDNLSLETVAQHTQVYPSALRAAVEGLRESLQELARAEGQPIDDWEAARLDRLLFRVANQPEHGCPGPVGLNSDAGRTHADRCPRCSRTLRLLRNGVLAARDLFPPGEGQMVPPSKVALFALVLHPEARRHKRDLEELLGPAAIPAGGDAWLIAESDLGPLLPGLVDLCREGSPPRQHVRGCLYTGPGRWSGSILLGPAPVLALEGARARPWSDVGGAIELPPPLPPPPKATSWWAGAAFMALCSLVLGAWVLRPAPHSPETPVEAQFELQAPTWTVRFETPDLAVIDVVVWNGDGRLSIWRRGVRSGKGVWATGEGDFELKVNGRGVAIVASPDGLTDLERAVGEAGRSEDPLRRLAELVRDLDARADVIASPGH